MMRPLVTCMECSARASEWEKTGREGGNGMDILWTGARQRTGKLQSEKRMEANESLFLSFIWIDSLAVFGSCFSLSCLSLFLIN